MKKIAVLFLLSFSVLASYPNDKEFSEEKTGIDHPIVGKWEYVKTILPGGNEVINLFATEHFYSDGTLLFVNVWLYHQSPDEFSGSPEEIKENFKHASGGIATYRIEKGNQKDKLVYTLVASTNKEDIGKSWSVDIKVEKDTFIYYFDNGNQLVMKRVKGN